MTLRPLFRALFVVAPLLSLPVAGSAQMSAGSAQPTADVKAMVVAPSSAAAGTTVPISIEMTLGPGWHVNSHTPLEDWLKATDVELKTSLGALGPVKYPAHVLRKFPFSETQMAVYEKKVVFTVDLALPAGGGGTANLSGKLLFQACNDQSCLMPDSRPLSATIAVSAGAATVPATSEKTPVSISAPGTASSGDEAPTSPAGADAAESSLRERYKVLGVPTLVFLGPDGKEIPGSRLSGFEKPKPFADRLDAVLAGRGVDAGKGDFASKVKSQGLFVTLLLIFVMGLALNLTPCVYPVIPITVGYFSMQAEKGGASRGRTLGLALIYVLGMAVVYSTLGVVAALSGGLFGAALQSPWAVAFISLVIAALGLSMLGLYEIQPPQSILRHAGSRTGFVGALLMGALVGFVAAPCIGPAVLGLLTYVAATGSPVLGFTMFFVLALGLGAPYVVLAMSSASLPRAGAWMIAVKHLFGILMLAAAGWFAKSLPGIGKWNDGFWLPAAILVVGGLWILLFEKEGKDRPTFRALLKLAGAVAIVVGVLIGWPPKGGDHLPWETYSEAAIERAAKNGQPVVIDFYADWCIPCKELERITFVDHGVAKRLEKLVRLRADLTHAGVGAAQ